MTWYSSKDVAYVFWNHCTITGFLNAVRIKTTAKLVDTTGLGDTWREMSDTGLREGELEMTGLYDGDVLAENGMNTVSATDRVASVLLEGNTVSKRFYGFQKAILSGTEVGISSDSVHTSTPVYTMRGAIDHGYVVAPWAARTTAGNTQATYADAGASMTAPRAYLNITGLTLGGYTNLVVTVQSCATSDGSYDDETAFTAVTAASTGSQCITLSGAVNRYLAVKWAWTGAGTGQSASFFVGVAPA